MPSHPVQPAAPDPRGTRRPCRETELSQAADEHDIIHETDMVGDDPGSDLACRIEPLSDNDWKGINSKIDRRLGGFFVSSVNQKVLPWHGMHQLAALSVFEMDPGIDAFEVSPERVTVMVAGKKRSYVPAYRLRRGSATVMVDILHRRQETHPLRPIVTATIRAGYARIGIHYRVLPERRVFAQPRLRNARFVLGHRGLDTCAETELAVVRVLGRKGLHDVASVAAALPDLPDARETLLALATQRRVKLGLWAATPGAIKAELISWRGLS